MSRISLSAMAVGLGLAAAACSSGASEAEIQSQIDVAVEEALNEQSSARTVASGSAQSTTPTNQDDSANVRSEFESQLRRLMGEVAAAMAEPITNRIDPLTCAEATTLRDLSAPSDEVAEQYWMLVCLESLFTGVVGDISHMDIRSTDSIIRPFEAEVQALITLSSNFVGQQATGSSTNTWRFDFVLIGDIWVLTDIKDFNDREWRDFYETLTGEELPEWDTTDLTEVVLLRVNPDARPQASTGETTPPETTPPEATQGADPVWTMAASASCTSERIEVTVTVVNTWSEELTMYLVGAEWEPIGHTPFQLESWWSVQSLQPGEEVTLTDSWTANDLPSKGDNIYVIVSAGGPNQAFDQNLVFECG